LKPDHHNEANFQLYMNAIQNRQNWKAPDMFLFSGRDPAPTTYVPMPGEAGGSCGWAQQVDIESNLLNFENRRTDGGCDDLRSLELPLSWTMEYLPYGFQQPDLFDRHHIFTRLEIADTCRPEPNDQSGFYETRNCVNYPSCSRVNTEAVFQQRLSYP
jgi:hypothetical protein